MKAYNRSRKKNVRYGFFKNGKKIHLSTKNGYAFFKTESNFFKGGKMLVGLGFVTFPIDTLKKMGCYTLNINHKIPLFIKSEEKMSKKKYLKWRKRFECIYGKFNKEESNEYSR